MRPQGILFDLDGTLVDTSSIWDDATRKALQACGIRLAEEELQSLAGKLLHHLMGEKGYDDAVIQEARSLRDAAMHVFLRERVRWCDGAEELFTSLMQHPTAIVTSSHAAIFATMDEVLSVRSKVGTVVVADDVRPHYKPHPKGLLLACERLGIAPQKCVYIGDQLCDLLAADAAQMRSILIRGTHTPKEAEQHATEIAGSFAELVVMIDG